MQMASNAILNIMFLILWADLAQAPNNVLLPCDGSDSPPPCIYRQPLSQDVCRGENVSISTVFELRSDIIPLITTPDITIYQNSQAIITGLSNNPLFQGEARWKASQMLSKESDKTGFLTVIIAISDVQPADEFMVHMEIQMSSQTLSTPDGKWFVVDNNCSLPHISQSDETSEIKIDNFDASNEHVESSGQDDIKLEFAELRSNVSISPKMCSSADLAFLISKVVLALVSIMFICMVVCVSIFFCTMRPGIKLTHLEYCKENMLEKISLIEGKEELKSLCFNKIEKNVEEMLEKVNQQMDDMNKKMALLMSGHIKQGKQIMDGLEILERTEEIAREGDSTGIYTCEQLVMNEQEMGRSDGDVDQMGDDNKALMIPRHIHDQWRMDSSEGMDRLEGIISEMDTMQESKQAILNSETVNYLDTFQRTEERRLCQMKTVIKLLKILHKKQILQLKYQENSGGNCAEQRKISTPNEMVDLKD